MEKKWRKQIAYNKSQMEMDGEYAEVGNNVTLPVLMNFFHLSRSSTFVLPTTLLDELSCTLREEEHLLEELPFETLLSFPVDFLDFLCTGVKSCKHYYIH